MIGSSRTVPPWRVPPRRREGGTRLRAPLWRLGCRGGVILELSLVSPAMILMFFGCLEVTLLIRAKMALETSAQTIADIVSRETTPQSATTINDACVAGGVVMGSYGGGTPLAAAIASVSSDPDTGAVAQDWQDTSCGGANAIGNAVGIGTPYVPTAGETVLMVQTSYKYKALVSFMLPTQVTLTASAYVRPKGDLGS